MNDLAKVKPATGMKVGIVIDSWKFSIFKKRLAKAGYSFTKDKGVMPDTMTLFVITDDTIALQKVVTIANEECSKSKSKIN